MGPMQDFTRDEYDAYGEAPSRLARLKRALSTGTGAVVAVALLAGLGSWVYGLGTREPEDIPIIRASAEPAKIRPEDPGGAVAPHQDITSYRVAESEPTRASAALVAPPPPEPRREDVAMGTLAAEPDTPLRQPLASTPELPARRDGAASGTAPVLPGDGSGSPGADGLAAGPDPAGGALGTLPPTADPVRDASELAPPLSPVAPERPGDLMARVEAAARSAERSVDERARRAAESSIQVQLAADPDEGAIRAMWSRIAKSNSDLLHEKALAVQTTTSGGTLFYRLRVGPFSGLSEARAVCQALKARGQDCIVARNG